MTVTDDDPDNNPDYNMAFLRAGWLPSPSDLKQPCSKDQNNR